MQTNMFEDFKDIRLKMPKIMVGTFKVDTYEKMNNMVKASLESKCFGFDTSPSYGTEKYLGVALQENKLLYKNREQLFISTKVDGIQMYKTNGHIENFVINSLKNLQLDYIDLLLIHWPFENYIENTWNVMEKLYELGIAKSIGICNVNERIMKKFMERNVFKKCFPQVIQNEISPLRTCEEELSFFKDTNIIVQAYSPLCRMNKTIRESKTLKLLSEKYRKDVGQIVLRWHIDRGIIPVFTSTKTERIKSNLDIFDFSLDDNDIKLVNNMNQDYKIFLESYGCPGI